MLDHRASAASRAALDRWAFVSDFARAFPPVDPASAAAAESRSQSRFFGRLVAIAPDNGTRFARSKRRGTRLAPGCPYPEKAWRTTPRSRARRGR